MSDQDHLVIRRVVRRVLEKTLSLNLEQARRIAHAVESELRLECGGDRLYVPVPDDADLQSRNRRIREEFQTLSRLHGAKIAFGILERREAIGERQLRRICARLTAGDSPVEPAAAGELNEST